MGQKEELFTTIDKLRSQNPEREEWSKFTFYDERGKVINTLLSDINMQIVQLHQDVLHNVFIDVDYYQIAGLLPMWLRDAGNSQESAMSKVFFEKLVKCGNSYLANKCLYYYDCEMLVNALQNRFNIVDCMLSQVFDVLTPILKYDLKGYDNVIFTINEESERVNAYINSIIINLASSCDIMTKIAAELSEMGKVKYDTYPKMRSANIQYGYAKKLPEILKVDGTYFAEVRPVVITKVETIRDEIIHNGSLDFHALIYYGVKEGTSEKWILMPSFNVEGTFTSYNGRKKFYDDPMNTWNKGLPLMIIDFLSVALLTLKTVRSVFAKEYYKNSYDLKKYQKEILSLSKVFYEVTEREMQKEN